MNELRHIHTIIFNRMKFINEREIKEENRELGFEERLNLSAVSN